MNELESAIALYQNDFMPSRGYAETALREGRPAFWSTVKHHAVVIAELMDALNRGRTMEEAVDLFPRHRRKMAIDGIKAIVPLNEEADMAIDAAYKQYDIQ